MQTRSKLRTLALIALMLGATLVPAATAHGQAGGQQCPNLGSSSVSGEVTTPLASEISGITASKSQPGVFWIHNDSGNSSDLYAVNASGDLLLRVILNNVPNWDYEDIAMGPGPDGSTDYIYIADVGANQLGRDTVRIFRLEEPKVQGGTITIPEADVERFVFAYGNPTGPGTVNRNAEAMAVDPITGDVVVIEKALRTIDGIIAMSWVYRIRQHELVEGQTIIAEPVVAARMRYDGETTRASTAAEFSHDGKVLFVKNWNEVMAWPRNAGQTIFQALAQNRETDCVSNGPPGEAITVGAEASALYSITEGNTPNITRVNVTLPDPGLTCDGVMANIKGTGAGETLAGTSRRDVIHGRGGSDVIEGRGGPDLICGGAGADVLYGNGGGDRMLGGSGADEVRGGPGLDSIFGNDGPDVVYGQNGGDVLRGNAGTDELRGGAGFDILNGGPGADVCGIGGGTGTKTNC
jgi:hypothetical protein